MTRTITAAAFLALCSCSESTGINQLDKARDALEAEVGSTPSLRKLGDTAQRVVRNVEQVSKGGDVADTVKAIGKGGLDVMCAGAGASGDAARRLSEAATRSMPGETMIQDAMSAYDTVSAIGPSISPCPQGR